jgi:D-alanyl-D-alanine carboxypeptidase
MTGIGKRMSEVAIAFCAFLAGCEAANDEAFDAGDAAEDARAIGDADGDDAADAQPQRDAGENDATGEATDAADDATEEAHTNDTADANDSVSDATADATADTPDEDAGPPRDFGPPVDPALAANLEAMVDAHFAEVQALGAAIGVRLPDGSWWEGVRGEACTDPASEVAVGDRFRIGSITKTWVAAAALQLVDEGEVALEAPVTDYLPGFDFDPAITVRACLSHTTGLFDLTDDVTQIEGDVTAVVDPRDIVAQSLAHGPDFAPGERYAYSNTNYFVLALLVEAVTGDPIATVLRTRFIAPLDLRDTFLEAAEPATTTFICGHASGVDITHLIDMSWAWAAGAMVSSNGDLCRWADALWRGDLVSPELLDLMMTPTVVGANTYGYGLGTMIQTRGGLTVVGHNGQTLGFQSELFIDPRSGLCVSVLANDILARPEKLGFAAWRLLTPTLGGE